MNKLRLFIILSFGLVLLVGIVYFVIGSLKPKIAGLYINTTPTSVVWINGREMGKTPYRDTNKPGESIIKLIPESTDSSFIPYETKTKLIAGVETVIRYDFANTEERSGGDVISFEKDERNQTSMVSVSIPDLAIIVIDGQQKAFVPYKTTNITPGEHELKFSLDGFRDRIVKVRIYEGYKLTAIIKLAKLNETQKIVDINPVPTLGITGDVVEILTTPTGYLRVRREPSSVGDEVGRVNPGERYPLVEIDTKTGWYKIEFTAATLNEKGKAGWISSQYAKKILVNQFISPIPTQKVSTPAGSVTSVQK